MITKNDLLADLKELGISKGDILNVKMSYKSIGKVEGGIKTVIDALLEAVGPEGTIVTDSFVRSYLPMKMRLYPQKCLVKDHTKSYAGALANVLITYPEAKRSPHPIQKFVAIGKHADMVLEHDVDCSPYSTLYKMAKMDAKNIRIGSIDKVVGVGTTHVAIDLLKWKQKSYPTGVTYLEKGKIKRFYHDWPDACATAFNNLIPIHKKFGGILKEGHLGEAEVIVSSMKRTLEIETTLGKQFPYFLKCQDPACLICRLQWKDSNGSLLKVIYHNCKKRDYKAIAKTLLWFFAKKETR